MDYQLLKTEIDTDPLAIGYSGFTDQQVADSLNAVDSAYTYNIPTFTGRQVKEAFAGNSAEWAALTEGNKQLILSLCARDDLDPHGVDADIFIEAAAGSTNTLQALNAARTVNVSRAVELGIVSYGATVSAVDVDTARRGTV